jgi:glycogen debranching enzyme
MVPAFSQVSERTPENLEKYKRICREHIHREMKGMYREAGGALQYPFLAPGSNQYLDMLWDWDSWLSDVAIGVDNDPSTFYRPDESSGSVFLNALMYKELLATGYIAGCLHLNDIETYFESEAEKLLDSIREHCRDPRDGFYYSAALNLSPVEKPDSSYHGPGYLYLHTGQPRTYDCLIQRLSVWSGFMAMWAGMAPPDQAEEMVKKHFKNTTGFNAPAGIRPLSPMEKMYDVRASGNPSSWLGPVRINVNYLIFRGLLNYGYEEEARSWPKKRYFFSAGISNGSGPSTNTIFPTMGNRC